MLASYPLLVRLCDVSLLHPFNYCRLVGIYQDVVDLDCVTQTFLASHWLTVTGLVFTFAITSQSIGNLNLRDLVHHLLPLDFVIDGQIYLEEMLVLVHCIRVKLVIFHEVVHKQLLIVILTSIGCLTVPFCIASLGECHLSAVFPSHIDFISSTQESVMK